MSNELTTPTPTPVGRLARGEQRKGEDEETDTSESRRSPWRCSWREEGEGGGDDEEGEGEG